MNADDRYYMMFDEIVDLKREVRDLQGKLSKLENRITTEGFPDLETMISKYKTVMLAANEISIETDEEIESLKARLAEAERREGAAVEMLSRAEVYLDLLDEKIQKEHWYDLEGLIGEWRDTEAGEGETHD